MNADNLPTINEIESQAATDLPKVKPGGYNDIDEYVNTYYALTRADFVSMVQQGLEQRRADRDKAITNLCHHPLQNCELASVSVTFGKQVTEFSAVSWQVYFDPKKVNWFLIE